MSAARYRAVLGFRLAKKELAMASPLQSLIATGTKLWLDSVDPDLVRANRALGATGATSNPIIIADLIQSGRFDDELERLLDGRGSSDDDAAWQLTDQRRPVSTGSVSAGVESDQRRRRLRELRTGSAAGRSRLHAVPRPSAWRATSSWAGDGRRAMRTA